jgi:hypothetical protein
MINTVYLLQASILLILATYSCSVKNTALIKGWQLFQGNSLHVTLLIDTATAAADGDGDGDGDDDDDDVLTSQSHRSITKVQIFVYFAGVPHGCVYTDYPPVGSEIAYSIRILGRLEEYAIYIVKCNTATRFDPPTGPSTCSHILL